MLDVMINEFYSLFDLFYICLKESRTLQFREQLLHSLFPIRVPMFRCVHCFSNSLTLFCVLASFAAIATDVSPGRALVNWSMKFFKLPNRADAVAICKALQQRRIFVPYESVAQAHNPPSNEFVDSPNAMYLFPEDEFDQYIKSLPPDQYKYVASLIIGPLGVVMSSGVELGGSFIQFFPFVPINRIGSLYWLNVFSLIILLNFLNSVLSSLSFPPGS